SVEVNGDRNVLLGRAEFTPNLFLQELVEFRLEGRHVGHDNEDSAGQRTLSWKVNLIQESVSLPGVTDAIY
ncbi:hypothetical protein ABTM48_20030, partial [Acinetobacter baumannii]